MVAIAGPIYYVALVTVLGLLWNGYDPIRQTQSELGSGHAPHALLMNVAGFMALGVVILAFAVAFVLTLRGGWTWSVAAALALAGGGMIAVGFFPCDPGCIDVTRTGELHGTFSVAGAIGLPVAALLSAAVFRSDARFGAGWPIASFIIGALALVSGPIIAAELLPDVSGLLQRAAMWLPILWLSAVAVRLREIGAEEAGGR
jgi:hypothetical membrane protein